MQTLKIDEFPRCLTQCSEPESLLVIKTPDLNARTALSSCRSFLPKFFTNPGCHTTEDQRKHWATRGGGRSFCRVVRHNRTPPIILWHKVYVELDNEQINERQQLTLEAIALRIEWLKLWSPTWQADRRGMIDTYGFSLLREIENVDDLGCHLKFANIYGSPPESDSDRMRFRRDIGTLEDNGLLVIKFDGRLRFGRPSGIS